MFTLEPGNLADWIMPIITIINSIIGIMIAISVHNLSKMTQKTQTTRGIYEQWTTKKQLSIDVPALTKLDKKIYSNEGNRKINIERHQQEIWIVLIIDVLFNSYVAQKNSLYPKEIYEADMKAHMKSLLKYNKEMVDRLLKTRGYYGEGVVGEFYNEVKKYY